LQWETIAAARAKDRWELKAYGRLEGRTALSPG
jgi:hypothetical protein